MSQTVNKHLQFLEVIASESVSLKQLKAIINTMTKAQFKVVREIAYNLVKGNIPISDIQKQSLQKYAGRIRMIASKKGSNKDKKALLTFSLLRKLINACMTTLKKNAKNHG